MATSRVLVATGFAVALLAPLLLRSAADNYLWYFAFGVLLLAAAILAFVLAIWGARPRWFSLTMLASCVVCLLVSIAWMLAGIGHASYDKGERAARAGDFATAATEFGKALEVRRAPGISTAPNRPSEGSFIGVRGIAGYSESDALAWLAIANHRNGDSRAAIEAIDEATRLAERDKAAPRVLAALADLRSKMDSP